MRSTLSKAEQRSVAAFIRMAITPVVYTRTFWSLTTGGAFMLLACNGDDDKHSKAANGKTARCNYLRAKGAKCACGMPLHLGTCPPRSPGNESEKHGKL